jgi:response regulator of citrate/malate metabolism
VGQGTTFNIELPAAEQTETAEINTTLANVAIIAPQGEWVTFASNALASAGKSIVPASEADIVLLDEALAAENLPPLGEVAGNTLILSAAPKVENITKYLQAGVKDVVLKPYTIEGLAGILA